MRAAASIGIVLLLLGCGRPPGLAPPALDVEPPARWSVAVDEARSPEAGWWREFADARLDSLIDEALAANYTLRAAAANVEAAAGLAKVAGADLWPQLTGSGRGSRSQQVFTGLPIPGRAGPLKSLSTSFGASLDLSWEFDLWGRLRADRAAAVADVQAARADYLGAAVSLAGQTAKAYFAAVEAQRQVELAEATVASFRGLAESVRERYERGLRPSIDLRFALTNLANAEAQLATRRLLHDNALRQLEVLLGRYPAAAIAVGEALPSVTAPPPGDLPAALVARRPDLVAAERRLAAANKRAGSARRQLYPRISLTASSGRTSDQLEDLLDGDFSVWSLIGNIVQPLFQGGRIRGGIRSAEAREDAALAGFAQQVLTAYAEIEGALDAERCLSDEQAALTTTVEQARASLELSEQRYRRGLADVTTVLEARRNFFGAQSRLLDTERRRLDTRVNLHLALGGGFQAGWAQGGGATTELVGATEEREP